MKILITAGNHAKVLSLKSFFPDAYIVFADYGDVPRLKTSSYELQSIGASQESSAAHLLLAFCLSHEITQLIPVYKFEILALKKSLLLFQEYQIEVLLPEQELPFFSANFLQKQDQIGVCLNGKALGTTASAFSSTAASFKNGVFVKRAAENGVELFSI